jgi:NADH dehydrogenase
MRVQNVVLTGGAGFVGSHIVHRLDAAGYRVKVLTRRRDSAKHLTLLPNVQVVECDLMDDAALSGALSGADAVIHLIGILHESGSAGFDRIHAELPARIATSCKHLGVARLLHISALNADMTGPSDYLRSKGEGEAAIKASGLAWTIFCPSVVFGAGDSFLTMFARLASLMPVLMLASPEARFQPVWVEDLAAAMVISLQRPETQGQIYNLCGPKSYTLRELVAYAANCAGASPCIIGLNPAFSWLQAWMMEWLPVKLMTRDNLRSMQVDSVCDCPFPALFDLVPTPLEAIAPDYLAGDTPRAGYLRFRSLAGR